MAVGELAPRTSLASQLNHRSPIRPHRFYKQDCLIERTAMSKRKASPPGFLTPLLVTGQALWCAQVTGKAGCGRRLARRSPTPLTGNRLSLRQEATALLFLTIDAACFH